MHDIMFHKQLTAVQTGQVAEYSAAGPLGQLLAKKQREFLNSKQTMNDV